MSSNSESTSQAPLPGALNQAVELTLRPWVTLAVGLVAVGVIGFLAALAQGLTARAWESYLVNLLFWMGIAQGGVVVAAAFYLTQGRWGGTAVYRLAEMFFRFIPVGFLLFWVMYAGRSAIFPWVLHPVADKAHWLNAPFLFARDGLALLLITIFSWWFVRASRRDSVRAWTAAPDNIALPPNIMRRLSPAIALLFAFIYSLLGFDLIMSLSPVWRSTLFGAYFFESCFWSALATMALTAVILQARFGARVLFFRRRVLHDLGKLVFAFSVFWVYLLFAQYLVIWYGDIPVETFFIAVRLNHLPWSVLSWAMVVLVWVNPFVVLMGRRPKRTPVILGTVALLGVIGIYVEYYVLVVPSLSPGVIPFGWVEVVVTLGFAGLFALCSFPGLRRVVMAASEPAAGELQ